MHSRLTLLTLLIYAPGWSCTIGYTGCSCGWKKSGPGSKASHLASLTFCYCQPKVAFGARDLFILLLVTSLLVASPRKQNVEEKKFIAYRELDASQIALCHLCLRQQLHNPIPIPIPCLLCSVPIEEKKDPKLLIQVWALSRRVRLKKATDRA